MNILSAKDTVETLLIKHPHLRDDDNKLIANIWYHESKNMGITELYVFLNAMAQSKFYSPESIRRIRAKLQEERPELRGELYEKRHGLQREVINQLNTI